MYERLASSSNGLTKAEAALRFEKSGPNTLPACAWLWRCGFQLTPSWVLGRDPPSSPSGGPHQVTPLIPQLNSWLTLDVQNLRPLLRCFFGWIWLNGLNNRCCPPLRLLWVVRQGPLQFYRLCYREGIVPCRSLSRSDCGHRASWRSRSHGLWRLIYRSERSTTNLQLVNNQMSG